MTAIARLERARPRAVYLLLMLVGLGSFLYPFWLPPQSPTFQAHAGDAPLIAAVVGVLSVAAMVLEVRRGTMNGATIAVLGVLGASAALLRLLDLPGGGSGIFFLVVLAGAAFGPRFGLLLGLTAMATSAVLTGGIGPWLPFQMLALAWMGGGAGVLGLATASWRPGAEVAALALYGWIWGFLYGAILNLWFWPFALGGGSLSWVPGSGLIETARRYWAFYLVTSLGWDAAGALANAALIALSGAAILPALRRSAGRLRPVVELRDRQKTT